MTEIAVTNTNQAEDSYPPLAQFTIGGIPLTLRRGPQDREFHIDAPKAAAAVAVIAGLLIDKLLDELDCECGFLDQGQAFARISNLFFQPCRGISVQGFEPDEETSRLTVGNREIQAVLSSVAEQMPGRQELSDHIEKLEKEEEERSQYELARYRWAVGADIVKPKTAPGEREEFRIGETRVTLESFPGRLRFFVGFEGPRNKTWDTARYITDALKEHKLNCVCRVPLAEVADEHRLNDMHCIVINPGAAPGEDDYRNWYHLESPPRMVIFASATYDKAMLASGLNIPRFSHLKSVLQEISESHPITGLPPEWYGDGRFYYQAPWGDPQRSEEFDIGGKHVTLNQFPGDSRLHLQVEGFSSGDMLEPVFLIGDQLQEHNLACDCRALAINGRDVWYFSCLIDPSYRTAFDAWDNIDDYSKKPIDPMDHLGNPARMVIHPLHADAAQLRDAGMKPPSFENVCAALDALSERFPPFFSDLLHAYNELHDKAAAREARRREKFRARALEKRKREVVACIDAVCKRLREYGLEVSEVLRGDLATAFENVVGTQGMPLRSAEAAKAHAAVAAKSSKLTDIEPFVDAIGKCLQNHQIQVSGRFRGGITKVLTKVGAAK